MTAVGLLSFNKGSFPKDSVCLPSDLEVCVASAVLIYNDVCTLMQAGVQKLMVFHQ